MIRGVIALGRSVSGRLVDVCPIAVLVQVEARAECVTVSGERDGPHVVVVRGLASATPSAPRSSPLRAFFRSGRFNRSTRSRPSV